jgi:rubrerythrin
MEFKHERGHECMIYTCQRCKFTFERTGEVETCPDCGKDGIRPATDKEIADFKKYSKEFQQASKSE